MPRKARRLGLNLENISRTGYELSNYAKTLRVSHKKQQKSLSQTKLKAAITQTWQTISSFAKPEEPVLVELVQRLAKVEPEYVVAALFALEEAEKITLNKERTTITVIYS